MITDSQKIAVGLGHDDITKSLVFCHGCEKLLSVHTVLVLLKNLLVSDCVVLGA